MNISSLLLITVRGSSPYPPDETYTLLDSAAAFPSESQPDNLNPWGVQLKAWFQSQKKITEFFLFLSLGSGSVFQNVLIKI